MGKQVVAHVKHRFQRAIGSVHIVTSEFIRPV